MPYAPPPLHSDSFLLTPPPSPRSTVMPEYPNFSAIDFKPLVPGLLTSLATKRLTPELPNYGVFARGGGVQLRWEPPTTRTSTTSDRGATEGRWVSFIPEGEEHSETRFIPWDQDGEEDEGWDDWDEQWGEEEWDDWDERSWSEYEEADLELEDEFERVDENVQPPRWIQYGVERNNVRRTVMDGSSL